MSTDLWPWLALGALGAYHGLNPAMGWLFAVAVGLQERRRRAVLQALLPIALGHEASIALTVALVAGLQLVAAPDALRLSAAGGLVLFGLYKLLKPRSHPRWVGMRVSSWDLVVWSFLMSSAHGAGLLLVPVVLGLAGPEREHAHAGSEVLEVGIASAAIAQDAAAVVLHTAAMLLVMGVVAMLVYEKLGLAVLRKAWLNMDQLWAIAIIVGGVLTLFT